MNRNKEYIKCGKIYYLKKETMEMEIFMKMMIKI